MIVQMKPRKAVACSLNYKNLGISCLLRDTLVTPDVNKNDTTQGAG
jgi:hypothetical protein